MRVQNDGADASSYIVKAVEDAVARWNVAYKEGNNLITDAILSANGFQTQVLAPGAAQTITVEMTALESELGPPAAKHTIVQVFSDAASTVVLDAVEAIAVPPMFVNSTGDRPDNNPGDALCDTGNTVNRSGTDEPECTLQAAIQETNALPGRNNINFDIPGAGVPTIQPSLGGLPTISEPLTIDATTQPGVGKVELDGSGAGPLADGLEITGGSSIVRGLIINRFTGSGIVLRDGGGNRIEMNIIGTNLANASGLGNSNHGVAIINSDGNLIGGPPTQCTSPCNVLAFNGGDGVFVDETSQDNAILTNQYIGNTGLPIDLAPDGPNPNDEFDLDTGANDRLNFPVVLRVREGSTEVEAVLDRFAQTALFPKALVQVFSEELLNAAFALIGETQVNTSDTGATSIRLTIPGDFHSNVSLTTTAIRSDGSFGGTSEFSVPQPEIPRVLVEFNFDPQSNAQLKELNTGRTFVNAVVKIDEPREVPVTVRLTVRDGAATFADGDFSPREPGFVTIPAGQTETATTAVVVLSDIKVESDEDFLIELEGLGSLIVGPNGEDLDRRQFQFTIKNDDQPCAFNLADVPGGEDGLTNQIEFRVKGAQPFVPIGNILAAEIEVVVNDVVVRTLSQSDCTSFRLTGTRDSDRLIVHAKKDIGGLTFVPMPADLFFDAGAQSPGLGDQLITAGEGSFPRTSVIHFGASNPATNGHDGEEVFRDAVAEKSIHFTGLNPLEIRSEEIGEIELTLPEGADDAVLAPIGDPADGVLQIGERPSTPRTFEVTSFPTPTGSITVNADDGDDRLEVVPLAVPLTFDGGPGVNHLRVNTSGAATTIVGNTVQVEGFAPITFRNFAVVDTDAQGAEPTRVTDVRLVTNRRQRVTAVVVSFDGELDRATAEDVNNYTIALPGRRGNFVTRRNGTARLRGASYDSDAHTVRLDLRRPLPPNRRFRLTVHDAVLDRQGVALDGDADGLPGGNHIADGGVWHDRVRYTDRDGDIVIVSLTPNGALADLDRFADLVDASLMEFVWDADGEARSLRLVGPKLASHVLRGRVIPTGDDGRTTIGQFADLDGVANRLPRCGAAQETHCFQSPASMRGDLPLV